MLLPRRLVVLLALVVALAACGGSGKHQAKASANGTPKVSNKETDLTVGTVTVETAGPDVNLGKPQQKAVLAASQTYLDSAVIAPLTSGAVGAGFAPLFDPSIRGAATGADNATLTDAPIGKVKKFNQTASPVAISALADGSGAFVYLASNFTVNVKATTADGPATLTKNVELTFAPAGSKWTVTAYRVTALRKLPASTASSTAAQSTGGTSK